MRIALVHEFLNQLGGAEKVLENFLEIWPDAVVHVIFYDKARTLGKFEHAQRQTSFLNSWPMAQRYPKFFLPLMTSAIESFRFDDYDVILSDSSSFAKGIKPLGKLHICYCHTPTRFLWTEAENYIQSQPYNALFKNLARSFLPRLRKWDREAAGRVNFFIANSENVRQRIKKYYQRDAEVIWPPVDTEFYHPTVDKGGYFLAASRLEPYKKIDLIVEAFNKSGLPLKVAGSGTGSERLRLIARPNIEFLGRVSDEELRDLYSGATAYVFAAEEDAGITLLEAQACGTPVIAYRAGGAKESVMEGVSGEFFDQQTPEAIIDVVNRFNASKYDNGRIRQHAQEFDKKVFQVKIRSFVETKYNELKPRA